jgi:TonB family protein
MQLEHKAKIYGVIGTILFQLALLLLLWFSVFSFIIPTEELGLSMQFGVDPEGGNDFFEAAPADYAGYADYAGSADNADNAGYTENSPAYAASEPPITGEKEFQTQNTEESVSLPPVKKEKTPEELRREQELKEQQQQKERERQEEARKIAEAKALKDAQDKKAEEIENRTKNLFSGGGGTGGTGDPGGSGRAGGTGGSGAGGAGDSNTSSGQGTGKGTGQQGNPFGSGDGTGSGSGTGGSNSYALTGRTLTNGLVKPTYSVYEEGTIVVTIIVDNTGTVINATIGSGTNIDNTTLRQAALEAARKTKFNKITSDKNQSGTITYMFKLQ